MADEPEQPESGPGERPDAEPPQPGEQAQSQPGEQAEAAGDEGVRLPTEEELREALDRVAVADVLLPTLATVASVGFHKLRPEARDLEQARLAIEALRALEPVLRQGGTDEAVVRDIEQARTNLQLAFAKAVDEEKTAGS